ncbi:MAG: hypothetical protein WD403_15950 [Pirellulales bacterium]
MTLSHYSPDALDDLALRMLDLAALVRGMAHASREHDVTGFQLHSNKVHEWLTHMENWAHDGAGRLEAAIKKQQGARRAQQLAGVPSRKPVRRKRGG